MTSKETLKVLKEFIGIWCDNITKEYRQKINKNIDIIEKNLEVLETYKKLEEELNCPIEVIFKTIKQKYIYTNYKSNIDGSNVFLLGSPNLKYDELETKQFCWDVNCYIKDYKKTWWLKEDKSE